jgi:hypothetical protein
VQGAAINLQSCGEPTAWLRSWLRFVTHEVGEAVVIDGRLPQEKRSQKRSQQVVSRTITSVGRHGDT